MALYRFEAKVFGRSDRAGGRSVVAAASYRAGVALEDAKYETRHDYSRRAAGIEFSTVVAPENAPAWATDRGQLWNQVEAKEDTHNRRASAQLCREFLPAIPRELSKEERQELVMGFVQDELVSRGMICDVSIHAPKEGDNFHAHILTTLRTVGPEGFGKKAREWNDTGLLIELRQAWETHANAALEKAGLEERVDCRSLEDRGIEQEPQPKIGVTAFAMEKKGIETENGNAVRHVKRENSVMAAIRDVVTHGEVTEFPEIVPESWWERLLTGAVEMAGAALDRTMELLRDESSGGSSWVAREEARRNGPAIEMDVELPELDFGLG